MQVEKVPIPRSFHITSKLLRLSEVLRVLAALCFLRAATFWTHTNASVSFVEWNTRKVDLAEVEAHAV